MRVGIGYDVHRFGLKEELVLGGVKIPYEMGLIGHSDADVLTHAIMDAILGGLGRRDIGYHFPDTEAQYRGISSLKLLAKVNEIMNADGYKLGNLDATIVAQAPKLSPYFEKMVDNIAQILEVSISQINIKATTTEKLGSMGRGEGISAQAIVLLLRREEEKEK